MVANVSSEELLKRTTSRCPVCAEAIAAEVWRVGDGTHRRVLLRKKCPEHGSSEICLSSDARFYWLAKGDDGNSCCGGNASCAAEEGVDGTLGRNAAGHNDRPFETLSTCLALIEIVNSCNLACPTC